MTVPTHDSGTSINTLSTGSLFKPFTVFISTLGMLTANS